MPPRRVLLILCAGAWSAMASGCTRNRTASADEVDAGGPVLRRGPVAPGTTTAVIPPYTNAACREGRAFIGDGASTATLAVDLPCLEHGVCGGAVEASLWPRMIAGGGVDRASAEGGQLVRLGDNSIVEVRPGVTAKSGRDVPTIYVLRSGDCGETWAVSRVDVDALDGTVAWGRPTAYADPLDPRGVLYLAMDARTAAGRADAAIAWADDLAARPASPRWRVQSLGREGGFTPRVAMASPAMGRLYLLEVQGAWPRLTPIIVDPEAGQLDVRPSWYVFQAHDAWPTAPPDSDGWDDRATSDDSLGLAPIGRLGPVDYLTFVYGSGAGARLAQIRAKGTTRITSLDVVNLQNTSTGGLLPGAVRARLLEGAPGSLAAALTWEEPEAATGRRRARWAGLGADPRDFRGAIIEDPAPIGGGVAAPGEPPRGAGFRGRGGVASFVLPWVEDGATPALRAMVGSASLEIPWETHAFHVEPERWYGWDGDWAGVDGVALECTSTATVVGMSAAHRTSLPHSILCQDQIIPMLMTSAVTLDVSKDSKRRDTVPDWDGAGYVAECAADEAVTAVAQPPNSKRMSLVRCTRMGGGYHRTSCSLRHFERVEGSPEEQSASPPPGDAGVDGGSDRGSLAPRDWASGYYKAQCMAGQIMKGLSVEKKTGALRAIECCYVSAY